MSSQMSPRAVLTVLGLSVAVVGCGVKQSDLDQQIAAVRAEAEAGDQAVGQRVDQLDTATARTMRIVNTVGLSGRNAMGSGPLRVVVTPAPVSRTLTISVSPISDMPIRKCTWCGFR